MTEAYQRDLHQLSTSIQAVQRALFSSNNAATKAQVVDLASRIEELREAFSNLSWVARDVAGDIRTAAVDFRHVIMGTLQDTQTQNSAKVTMLDSWTKSLEPRKKGARDLPQQFERFSKGLADLLRDVRGIQGSNNPMSNNDQQISGKAQTPRQSFWGRLFSVLFGKRKPTQPSHSSMVSQAVAMPKPAISERSLASSSTRKGPSLQSRDLQAGRKSLENEIEGARKKMSLIVTKSQTFTTIYNEIDQHIQALKKLLSAKVYNVKKESEYNTSLASFRPKLEQYAKILEEYQKTVP